MFIFFLFYLINIFNITVKSEEAKIILDKVTDGIYNIVIKRKFSCLTYVDGLRTSREKYGHSRLSFRLTEVKPETNQNGEKSNNDINENKDKKYFTIEHVYSYLFIGVEIDHDKKSNYPIISTEKVIKSDIVSYEWEFEKVENNAYLIKNKAGCYLKEEKINFICHFDIRKKTDFHLLKLYTEVSHTKEDLLILDKEPIDIFIKYIDLSDPNLIREGVPQIKKDVDNEELRYSIEAY